jgi:hypothetical protein
MNHSAAWHDRQLVHVRACLAEADRVHTPEEIAAAHAALAVRPSDVQSPLPITNKTCPRAA